MRDLLLEKLAADEAATDVDETDQSDDSGEGTGEKEIETDSAPETGTVKVKEKGGRKRYNVTDWLGKTTLDVIGLAGTQSPLPPLHLHPSIRPLPSSSCRCYP